MELRRFCAQLTQCFESTNEHADDRRCIGQALSVLVWQDLGLSLQFLVVSSKMTLMSLFSLLLQEGAGIQGHARQGCDRAVP
jgi:hypothetical protein